MSDVKNSASAARGNLYSTVRPAWRPESILGWSLVGILGVLIVLPLAFVLVQGVFPGLGLVPGWRFEPGLLTEITERPLWRASLFNSLLLATGAMICGATLGSGLAILRHTVAFPGARLLDGAAWALMVSPSFILAQGWVLFASPSGVVAGTLGWTWVSRLVFSPFGLILIMSLTQYPLAYLATAGSLKWNDISYQQSAALSGAGPLTALLTIRLPLLTPALLSGAILVFVDSLGDFGLPAALSSSYNFPTLPYSIYASVRQSPVRFDLGGVLSFYLVGILAIAIFFYLRVMRRSHFDFLTSGAVRTELPPAKHPWVWTIVAVLEVGVVLGIPLGSSLQVSLSRSSYGGLNSQNFTLEHYQEIFSSGSVMLEGARNSLTIAAVAAIVTVILGFLVGVVLTFTDFRAKNLIDISGTVALAVPGIVLAVGFIFLWNQPVLSRLGLSLYGNPALLVLAGVAGSLPIAVRLQMGALAQVPASFLQAGALSGVGLLARLRTILFPLVAAATVSALAAVFAASVFDLAATSMLAPPNFATLPLEILAEYDRGRVGYATAGAIVSAVIILVAAPLLGKVGVLALRLAMGDAAETTKKDDQ